MKTTPDVTRRREEQNRRDQHRVPASNAGETIRLEDLTTGPDFNNYHGDFSYWDLPLQERMKKTEALLLSLSQGLKRLESVVEPFVSEESGSTASNTDHIDKLQLPAAIWPVVFDVAIVNLRLDNYVFYFDLNTCTDPFDLIFGMVSETHGSVSRAHGILADDLDHEKTEWFHSELESIHPGLAFMDKKLTYDVQQLQALLESNAG
jgi:hypothetical protein